MWSLCVVCVSTEHTETHDARLLLTMNTWRHFSISFDKNTLILKDLKKLWQKYITFIQQNVLLKVTTANNTIKYYLKQNIINL